MQRSLPWSLPSLYPVSKLPTSTAQFQPRDARSNLPHVLRPRGPMRARDVAPGAAPLDDTHQRHRVKNVSCPRRWMSKTLHHLHPSKDHTRMIQHKSISASPLPPFLILLKHRRNARVHGLATCPSQLNSPRPLEPRLLSPSILYVTRGSGSGSCVYDVCGKLYSR